MIVNIGPAVLSFEGSSLGRTKGGGTLTFFKDEVTWYTLDDALNHEEVFKGASGVLKMFEIDGIDVEDDPLIHDWGELKIDTTRSCSPWGFTLTLPSTRIYLPDSLALGTFDVNTWDLRFFSKKVPGGKLFTLT